MMAASSGGTSGFTLDGDLGVWFRIASTAAARVLPWKGGFPVAISYSTAPREKRSLRVSAASPLACSGDMYAAVPTTASGGTGATSSARGRGRVLSKDSGNR